MAFVPGRREKWLASDYRISHVILLIFPAAEIGPFLLSGATQLFAASSGEEVERKWNKQ